MEDIKIIHRIEGRLRNEKDDWQEVSVIKNITLKDAVARIGKSYAYHPDYKYRILTTEINDLDWLVKYFK